MQPEGRRGQDHHLGEPCRGLRRVRPQGAARRLRPAGRRLGGPGRELARASTPRSTTCCSDPRSTPRASSCPTDIEGLDVLPANIDLSAAEVQLVGRGGAGERTWLGRLRSVEDDYDLILIDCQPSLGLLTVNALVAAHGVIIPLACEYLRDARRGPAGRYRQQGAGPAQPEAHAWMRSCPPCTTRARCTPKRSWTRVRDAFGDRVTETMIGRTVKFPDSSVASESILTFAPKHAGAESVPSARPRTGGAWGGGLT